MAFPNGFTSPRDENRNSNSFTSPIRTLSGPYVPQLATASNDRPASGLVRRQTTESVNTIPSLYSLQSPLSPIGQQRRQAAEQHDFGNNVQQRPQQQATAQQEYAERLKQSSLRARQEADRLQKEYEKVKNSGHQSEPTTPPEPQDNPFSSFSRTVRPNRFSLNGPLQSSSTSSFHRSTLSGSQHNFAYFGGSGTQTPGNGQSISHRTSDEEEEEDAYSSHLPSQNRRAAVRKSMPVNFDYQSMGSNLPDVDQVLGIGSLLLDDDDYPLPQRRTQDPMDRNSLLHMAHDENGVPTLRRSQADSFNPYQVSSVSSQRADGSSAWPPLHLRGHRQGQKSLPMNTLRTNEEETQSNYHGRNSSIYESVHNKQNNRHSMDISLNTQVQPQTSQSNRSSIHMSPISSVMPNLRPSLSTNDIPTINSFGQSDVTTTGNMTHEQRLHNHNATLGRIPPNAVGHRRDASIGTSRPFVSSSAAAQSAATTQASQYIFTAPTTNVNNYAPSIATSGPGYTNNQSFANRQISAVPVGQVAPQMPYSIHQTTPQVVHSASNQWNNSTAVSFNPYSNQYYYQQQQPQYGMPRSRDSQQWVMNQRRGQKQTDDAMRGENRFANTQIEEHIGQIFEVSKDQNGCRYLQKKIEEDKAKNLPIIFGETKDHIVELMKDPFGNYLCQKLLEYCNADQRTILINTAAPSMVEIAINQHGTRALQKMIEHISSPEQVDVICRALGSQVVTLIQDLNGNHVIQKCLNHLRPDNAQFIFDAVGSNAYLVGTHRHGCCVLQRCIDHATGPQQEKLISEITGNGNALQLMQNAYGNYVIQYILDLNENKYTGPLCNTFTGHVVELSKQKFSSNVIEKAMRMAEANWQRQMIHELLSDPSRMEDILRDPYANYVIQTAIEHGPQDIQDRLWQAIKIVMPAIRGTPAARRLSQKLASREGNRSGHTSGSRTPQDGIHSPTVSIGNGMNGYGSHYNSFGNNVSGPYTMMPGSHSIANAQPYRNMTNGGAVPQMGHIYPQSHGTNQQNFSQAQNGMAHNRNGQFTQNQAGFF